MTISSLRAQFIQHLNTELPGKKDPIDIIADFCFNPIQERLQEAIRGGISYEKLAEKIASLRKVPQLQCDRARSYFIVLYRRPAHLHFSAVSNTRKGQYCPLPHHHRTAKPCSSSTANRTRPSDIDPALLHGDQPEAWKYNENTQRVFQYVQNGARVLLENQDGHGFLSLAIHSGFSQSGSHVQRAVNTGSFTPGDVLAVFSRAIQPIASSDTMELFYKLTSRPTLTLTATFRDALFLAMQLQKQSPKMVSTTSCCSVKILM